MPALTKLDKAVTGTKPQWFGGEEDLLAWRTNESGMAARCRHCAVEI